MNATYSFPLINFFFSWVSIDQFHNLFLYSALWSLPLTFNWKTSLDGPQPATFQLPAKGKTPQPIVKEKSLEGTIVGPEL